MLLAYSCFYPVPGAVTVPDLHVLVPGTVLILLLRLRLFLFILDPVSGAVTVPNLLLFVVPGTVLVLIIPALVLISTFIPFFWSCCCS